MVTIGMLMDDLTAEGTANWNYLPGGGRTCQTYDFPIIREVIPGGTEQKNIDIGDMSQTPAVVEAARRLEKRGVKAITTSCGFLALYQREVARAVSVPVFISSLIQVPLVYRMLGDNQKVGIITWSKKFLSERHFNGVGWSSKDIPVVIAKGLDETKSWGLQKYGPEQIGQLEADTVKIAKELVRDNPDVGAIVFECCGLPTFNHAVQQATGLPVFDISTLIKMVFMGVSWLA